MCSGYGERYGRRCMWYVGLAVRKDVGALATVFLIGGKHPAVSRPYQTNERHFGLAETNFITDTTQSECCSLYVVSPCY